MKKFSDIADRLQQVMDSQGLTQRDFAKILETSDSSISGYLSGTNMPGGQFLRRLNERFGTDITWLLTGTQVTAQPTKLLTPRENALIDNYKHLSENDKKVIERTAFALSKPDQIVQNKVG